MYLLELISQQLQQAPLDQASLIQASDGEMRMEVKLADWNRLGCLLDALNLQKCHSGKLNLHPSQIVGRITYLGERLETLENEGEAGRAILRSNPPRRDGDVISFFEVILYPGKDISLVRYKYDPRVGERVHVSVPLSRDTLERLMRDLIELAGEN
jgi:hypothetical protein